MRQALRPYVTAGIAIAGAGVIAVTPVSPSVPEPAVEFSSIRLSGSVQTLDLPAPVDVAASAIPPELSPAEAYQYVAQLTAAFVMDAIAPIVSNPTPIVDQVIANQLWYANLLTMGVVTGASNIVWTLSNLPEYLSTAAAQLMAGDPEAAIMTLWSRTPVELIAGVALPLVPSFAIPVTITQNLANVVATVPTTVLELGSDVLSAANNTVAATAASVRSIAEAAASGDPTALANAILVAPASIASGLLIGDIAEGGHNPGLINGVLKHLVLARETIAEALGAPPREIPEALSSAVPPASARIATLNENETDTVTPAETDNRPVARPEEKPTLVRTSAKAVPGKAGLTGKRGNEKPELARSISNRISATVNKIGADVKKAFTNSDEESSGDNTESGGRD
ncbi:hypothetical protein [Mycolicibacterium sp. HK-90]|uniref:hypothetical protein n=1 Tax=Mycolicibacterium sp. HK-90 TaxID=3056937 RepID=UPI00265A36E6|nr:hypothetical protein [Mycolicibacterium sp. HK-90]WKG02101.1 hypothetical protein QU592_23155 [Mycolicibacterium sp. HK-90]